MSRQHVESDDEATAGDADEDDEERHDAHLRDVDPGAGCTEIWEHLSERRDEE